MAPGLYCYQPLPRPSDQIRLLTILPSRDNDSAIRACLTVHRIPLPDASRSQKLWAHLCLPPYFAISYSWALGAKVRQNTHVLINGKRFYVDENVHDALRVFLSYASMPLSYWIDCICINQTDEAEKSCQIPLMLDIYGRSVMTLVWLGTQDAVSRH